MLVVDYFVLVVDFIQDLSRLYRDTMALFVQINCRRCVAALRLSLNYDFSLPF